MQAMALFLMPLWAHKVLVWPVLPIGLSILVGLAGLALRRRSICALSLAILWLASTPVVGQLLMRRLELTYPQLDVAECGPADVAVVLGGGSSPGFGKARIEWSEAADRFAGGMDLFAAGRVRTLVFTRGKMPWSDGPDEGSLLREEALRRGVPADRIVLTSGEAGNTADEAREVGALMRGHGWKSLILVTSAYHLRRAMRLFEGTAPLITPFPVDYRGSTLRDAEWTAWMPSGGGLGNCEEALREHWGLLWYALPGRK
jgi:uncharacterized SAM-binding protein YcdF (DUF218 family)